MSMMKLHILNDVIWLLCVSNSQAVMTECSFFAVEANLKFSQIGISENKGKKWREVSECRIGMLRNFKIIFIIARKQ